MQRIGGGVTRTLMDSIVQNELSIGADLGIISGFELSVPHMVLFHPHESGVIVCLGVVVVSVKYLSLRFIFPELFRP